jgi:hypothetical protein
VPSSDILSKIFKFFIVYTIGKPAYLAEEVTVLLASFSQHSGQILHIVGPFHHSFPFFTHHRLRFYELILLRSVGERDFAGRRRVVAV